MTYQDGRILFLADAEVKEPEDIVTVPVLDSGWQWELSGTGKGALTAPDGSKHCQFDLLSGTIQFEPDGEETKAPGLSASLVQEMGEKYVYHCVFTEPEKKEYDDHVVLRTNTKKAHDRSVRDSLRGKIQLEYNSGGWLAHVDTDYVKEQFQMDIHPTISKQQGIDLFNRLSEKAHAAPICDPIGYMALEGNMYEFIQTEYRNQYENVLQAIDNQMIDGSGYAVAKVLDNVSSIVRKNIQKDCLPDGEDFGNLRFLKATEERKDAARNFVKCRVSKTLTYEKKRSYEKETIARTNTKYYEAANRLKDAMFPPTEQASELNM